MKTIIAGGRNYALTTADYTWLDTLNITTVVSGGATGADFGGEQWAKSRGIPIVCFEANWTAYGKAAGPIRNKEMAQYADAVVLFPGGKGTQSMRNEAKAAVIQIFER